MVSILQSILMGFGPFYFYPWKVPINHIAGDSYEVGYAHFRVGHRHPVNLGLHLACLLIQVAGNFSLLYAIDNAGWYPQPLPGIPILSALSAATWSAYLFTAPVNKVLPLISSAVIFAGYTFAPRITPRFMDKFAASTFIAALLISNFAIAKKKALPLPQFLKGAAFMGIWYFAWPFLEAFVAQSAVGDYARQNKTAVMIGVAAYVFGLALTKNPLKKLVISSVVLVRLASAAVGGDPILFFWSYAFSASLFQGITHSIVREEATLLSLEREEEAAKLRFEWAHVTHFPNLLLNAVVDAVFGPDRKKTA